MWWPLCFPLYFVAVDRAESQPVRGAFPSPSVQIVPMMVAQEKGFYQRGGVGSGARVRKRRCDGGPATACQSNPFYFLRGVANARGVGRKRYYSLGSKGRTSNLFADRDARDIQKIADLKGKKIGVTFGGSTAAGTKALLELNKLNPDKDVEYISLLGQK